MAIRKFKIKLLFIGVSVVLLFLLAEVIISIFKPAPLFRKISFLDSGYTYMLSPNIRLLYEPKPNVGQFNKYGHRGEVHEPKKGNKRRLVFIGDSVVEGLAVEPNERFTELLSEKLSDKKFEIINLAVEGYSFIQEFEYLKEKALNFCPDYVIWCLTCNDLQAASSEIGEIRKMLDRIDKNSFYKEYYKNKEIFESFLCKSQLYRYIKLFTMYFVSSKNNTEFENPYVSYLNIDDVERTLKQLPEIADRQKLKFLFVLLPVNISDQGNDLLQFESLFIKNNIIYVNLNKYLLDLKEEKKSLFLDNDPCHFSKKGHSVVANAFFQFMQRNQEFFI